MDIWPALKPDKWSRKLAALWLIGAALGRQKSIAGGIEVMRASIALAMAASSLAKFAGATREADCDTARLS